MTRETRTQEGTQRLIEDLKESGRLQMIRRDENSNEPDILLMGLTIMSSTSDYIDQVVDKLRADVVGSGKLTIPEEFGAHMQELIDTDMTRIEDIGMGRYAFFIQVESEEKALEYYDKWEEVKEANPEHMKQTGEQDEELEVGGIDDILEAIFGDHAHRFDSEKCEGCGSFAECEAKAKEKETELN